MQRSTSQLERKNERATQISDSLTNRANSFVTIQASANVGYILFFETIPSALNTYGNKQKFITILTSSSDPVTDSSSSDSIWKFQIRMFKYFSVVILILHTFGYKYGGREESTRTSLLFQLRYLKHLSCTTHGFRVRSHISVLGFSSSLTAWDSVLCPERPQNRPLYSLCLPSSASLWWTWYSQP